MGCKNCTCNETKTKYEKALEFIMENINCGNCTIKELCDKSESNVCYENLDNYFKGLLK